MISVIIPIYNIEKKIERCIESIIKQTYRNLDIILVDDGSTDDSKNICEDYSKKDERIKVIHKNNGGVSSARNIGLECAKGDYISFVDGDDYIEPNMYEKMLNSFTDNIDIVICNYFKEDSMQNNTKKWYNFGPNKDTSFNTKDFPKFLNKYSNIDYFLCNKLYKKSILYENNHLIKFDETIHMSEDALFNTLIFCINQQLKVQYISQKLYHYVTNTESITNTNISKKKITYLNEKEKEINLLSNNNFDISIACAHFVLFYNKYDYTFDNYLSKKESDHISEKYKQYKKCISIFKLPLKLRIKYIISCIKKRK